MRARGNLLAFVPAAVVTTAAAMAGRERAHLASKMLLAPSLAAGVVATRGSRSTSRNATLVAALVGSTVGDWFMNASGRAAGDPVRSRALLRRGAGAFAVQQAGLLRLLLADGARPRAVPTAFAGSTLVGLTVVDTEGGARPDPVLTAYGLLLGSMTALAASSGRWSVRWGGALFLLSDATIVVGERVAKTPRQRAIVSGTIMATYAAALALLVHGLRDEPAHLGPVHLDPVPEDFTA